MPNPHSQLPTHSPMLQPPAIPSREELGEREKEGNEVFDVEHSTQPNELAPARATFDGIKLYPLRSKKDKIALGHRRHITGLLRAGHLSDALDYATRHAELDWYSYKLSVFRPDLGEAGVATEETEQNMDKSIPESSFLQCAKEQKEVWTDEVLTLKACADGAELGAAARSNIGGVGGKEEDVKDKIVTELLHKENEVVRVDVIGVVWPGECVGKIVGYCGNKQMMKLGVEVEVVVPGFMDNRAKGVKECSVWKGGYNLFVGESVKVKLERSIGDEAWYEVVARGAAMNSPIQANEMGSYASNDGMTVAPVGFAGQALRIPTIEPIVDEVALIPKETHIVAVPLLDNIQDLASRERTRALEEATRQV